jgi:hypothetical protein
MKMRLWHQARTRMASSLTVLLSCPAMASSSRQDDFQYNTFCIDKVIVRRLATIQYCVLQPRSITIDYDK